MSHMLTINSLISLPSIAGNYLQILSYFFMKAVEYYSFIESNKRY